MHTCQLFVFCKITIVLRNQHGLIADFGMVVIVCGQKLPKCPPKRVCPRIKPSSLPSPQMAVFRQQITCHSSFCIFCHCHRGTGRYGMGRPQW